MLNIQSTLDQISGRAIDQSKVFGTSFCIRHRDQEWHTCSGNLQVNSQFFIASTTKLFVTALILHHHHLGLLNLDDPIHKYLNREVMDGLLVYKGSDYSDQITVRNLLAHTSGIPDYFQMKNQMGKSLELSVLNGEDIAWTFEDCIARSKSLLPPFAPNTHGKAHYSDTNFQLLGRIIEIIAQRSLSNVFMQMIFVPLGMQDTYLYIDPNDRRPASLHYKNKPLDIPKAMTSFRADGGVVSTSTDMMKFLTAFFEGHFFPKNVIDSLKVWNRIFFPMRSGIGIHLFKLPWIFNPTGAVPALIGHSGLSGALAYHSPEKDLFITGTVNQVAYPDTSFKLAIKLILAVLKADK